MAGLKKLCCFCAAFFFFSTLAVSGSSAAAAPDKNAVKEALREILKEEPELVLNILRENSEIVLEIAQEGSMQRNRKATVARWKQELNSKVDIDIAGHAVRGDKNAPVTIVGYTDFLCGYCQQSEFVLEKIMEKYKGKVRFVYKPMAREGNELSGLCATYVVAAMMQDEAKGWQYYDLLFKSGSKLTQGGEAYLRASALQVGLDPKKLFNDIGSKKVKDFLAKDKAEAEKLELKGTPYFFVNNVVVRGFVAQDLFEEAIQMVLDSGKK